MYKEYMKERQHCEFLEGENYFVTYKIAAGYCYLQDMYIVPEKRGMGFSKDLVLLLEDIAKEASCKYMTTTVNLSNKDAENRANVKTAFKSGFRISGAEKDCIYFIKDI